MVKVQAEDLRLPGEVTGLLEVPMRRRRSQTVPLSRLMRQLGWTNIRAQDLNPDSYPDRVRGYAREVPGHPATVRLPRGCGLEGGRLPALGELHDPCRSRSVRGYTSGKRE